jgi:hypothetical protein
MDMDIMYPLKRQHQQLRWQMQQHHYWSVHFSQAMQKRRWGGGNNSLSPLFPFISVIVAVTVDSRCPDQKIAGKVLCTMEKAYEIRRE